MSYLSYGTTQACIHVLDIVNALPLTGTNAFFIDLNRPPHGLAHADPVLEDHEDIADHEHKYSGENKGHVALPGFLITNYQLTASASQYRIIGRDIEPEVQGEVHRDVKQENHAPEDASLVGEPSF